MAKILKKKICVAILVCAIAIVAIPMIVIGNLAEMGEWAVDGMVRFCDKILDWIDNDRNKI